MLNQLDSLITGYCELKDTPLGKYVVCDKPSKLSITLFSQDGIVTFPSMSGDGELQRIEVMKLFRLGSFNFALISDEDSAIYLQLVPHTLFQPLIFEHHVYDFGINVNVRALLHIKGNHLIFTPCAYTDDVST
jgi:hypothetical protein